MRYLTVTALLLLTASAFAGETRYVSDELVITLRTGQGNAFQILRSLPSGTPLEILEEDGDFARVRTTKGTEGWVRTQYLVNEPVAKDRLAALQEQASRLNEKVRSLTEQLTTVRTERAELANALEQSRQTAKDLEQHMGELQRAAAEPLRLSEENQAMKGRIAALENELTRVNGVNDDLRKGTRRQWFITGAAVAGSGILIGLILPLLRGRRRSGWNDF